MIDFVLVTTKNIYLFPMKKDEIFWQLKLDRLTLEGDKAVIPPKAKISPPPHSKKIQNLKFILTKLRYFFHFFLISLVLSFHRVF